MAGHCRAYTRGSISLLLAVFRHKSAEDIGSWMWPNHLKGKRFCDTQRVHPCKLGHDVHVMDGHSRAYTRGSISSLLTD
jgi:hypothetical protein